MMAEIQFGSPSRPAVSWGLRIFVVFVAAAAIVGAVRHQAIAKAVNAWFQSPPPRREPSEDQVVVLMAAKKIPAYGRIELGMLTSDIKSKAAVEGKGILLDARDIVYRVPIVDIEPGATFSEKLFAPRGTRPGLSAGIPPGWVAVTLNRKEIEGQLNFLRTGDKVALLAQGPAKPFWIATEARVLHPLRDRSENKEVASSSTLLNAPPKSKKENIEELSLALQPEGVLRLSKELAAKSSIHVLLLSGIKDGSAISIDSTEEDAAPPPNVVELIEGSKRVDIARRQEESRRAPLGKRGNP